MHAGADDCQLRTEITVYSTGSRPFLEPREQAAEWGAVYFETVIDHSKHCNAVAPSHSPVITRS